LAHLRRVTVFWSITISIWIVLPTSVASTPPWWFDAHAESTLAYSDDEVWWVDHYMDGKAYGSYSYTVFQLMDEDKDFILTWSLGDVKIFHWCGHGGYVPLSNNFIRTHFDENIRPWELPGLGNVYGGGATLITFYNSCDSGRVGAIPSRWLLPKSIDQGAVYAIGHTDDVMDYDAYLFGKAFYYYAGEGDTVGTAFWKAVLDSEVETATSRGDNSIRIVG
jgi:hypothetical protein